MRKIVTALMGTVSGLVLLFSYYTSSANQAASDGASVESTAGSSQSVAGSSPDGGSAGDQSTAETTHSSTDSTSGTYTGDAVDTRYGAVQVEITVEDGVITSSEAVQYPNRDHHDQRINAYAVPVLNAAAVEAQSADIDAVSGATVTSLAYAQSLQSAIDQAFQ
ncbi:hypothetical protein TESS_TESS_02726 [Tessaracoccus sp. O5.2]|uniref:FMN-binding protein n=1 Tax=Tessaracoccus sp. O5.2 TaxID=3157622 RepID=UPI0035EB81F3